MARRGGSRESGAHRPALHHAHKIFDLRFAPFGYGLDRAIADVAHPAGHSDLHGMLLDECAKPDGLHTPPHPDVYADTFTLACHR